MKDVVAFVRARLDEDEAAALRDLEDPASTKADNESVLEDESLFECLVITKGRVLRDVEAKRRILKRGEDCFDPNYDADVTRLLASVYSDHPDYDRRWTL